MQVTRSRIVTAAIATASLVIAASSPGLAVSIESVPNPRQSGGWISDGANILSPSTEATINAEIQALESATSAEVAVVTVTDTKGGAETPKVFAHNLFNAWGIGKAGKNNGVLVLIAKNNRRVEIEVGRGLTNKLTGDRIKEILNAKVTPAFKQGHYDSGTMEGTKAIIQAIESKSGATTDLPGATTMQNTTEKAPSSVNSSVASETDSAFDIAEWIMFVLVLSVPVSMLCWLLKAAYENQRSQDADPDAYIPDHVGRSRRKHWSQINYSPVRSRYDHSSSSDYSNDYRNSSSSDSSSSFDYSSSSDSGSSSDFGGGSSDSSSGGGSDW